jgi:hypothetical protein
LVNHSLASVSADDIRDVINVTSEEVPDDKISKMIKRAEVTLELETEFHEIIKKNLMKIKTKSGRFVKIKCRWSKRERANL